MINVSYWPMLIGALFMLVSIFGGAIIVLMAVDWINGRWGELPLAGESTLSETHNTIESSRGSRCSRCFGSMNEKPHSCTPEYCSTWKTHYPTDGG